MNNDLRIACLVVDNANKCLGKAFIVYVSDGHFFSDLAKKIIEDGPSKLRHWRAGDLSLFKPKEKFTYAPEVESEFQNPLAGCVHVIVRLPGTTDEAVTSRKRKRITLDDVHTGFEEAQAHDVEMAKKALPPSSAAPPLVFGGEQETRPVLNGRPYQKYGPPIGLFHPVFDSFQAAMKDNQSYGDADTYESITGLFKASADIYNDQFGQVEQAVELLHYSNFVFGDLRAPNILIAAGTGKVMIIDFDWCSKADEGRYPPNLNDYDIKWPEGVGPSCVMRKRHDMDMLKKLPRHQGVSG